MTRPSISISVHRRELHLHAHIKFVRKSSQRCHVEIDRSTKDVTCPIAITSKSMSAAAIPVFGAAAKVASRYPNTRLHFST